MTTTVRSSALRPCNVQNGRNGPPELFDQDVDAAEPVLGLHDQAVDRCLSHLCNQPL